MLNQQARLSNINRLGFSVKEFEDYRDQTRTMEMVEHHAMNFILFGRESRACRPRGVFFDVLGVKPLWVEALCRKMRSRVGRPCSCSAISIGSRVTEAIRTSSARSSTEQSPSLVIGVLPPVPEYPSESDVYAHGKLSVRSSKTIIDNRQARLLSVVFGRLKPGVEVAQAQQTSRASPATYSRHTGRLSKADWLRHQVDRLDAVLTQEARPTFLILLGTTVLVLLIVSANVANLNLARVLQRQSEIAMRTALGASRSRLVRQMVTESMLLSLVGGALGVLSMVRTSAAHVLR